MAIKTDNQISYEQAYQKVIDSALPYSMQVETLDLLASNNRILAEEIVADLPMPLADSSSMDGYAVYSDDLLNASPETPVALTAGTGIDAGTDPGVLKKGTCNYVATGALIPDGADAVVKIEDIQLDNKGFVRFSAPVKLANFIRKAGAERKTGQLLAQKGIPITPYVIALAASVGKTTLKVAKKPVVGIITSGDELVMPYRDLKPWQVRSSNNLMLAAQVANSRAMPIDFGIAADTLESCKKLFFECFDKVDIIVSSGGISMGRKDPFKLLFAELGLKPIVYGVKMKPGKPFFFAEYNHKPIFGLPGNQVSTAVTFEIFVKPFIKKLIGIKNIRPEAELELCDESKNFSDRDFFERAFLVTEQNGLAVKPLTAQESYMISSIHGAHLLYLHPANIKTLAKGSKVRCFSLKDDFI